MSIGWPEIVLIVLVVLLIFGAKRIPDLARALGRASHEFKKAKDDIIHEGESLAEEAERSAAREDDAAEKQDKK